MKAVREDKMPRDETGIEQPLDAKLKSALLESGGAFEALVQAAKDLGSEALGAVNRGGAYSGLAPLFFFNFAERRHHD